MPAFAIGDTIGHHGLIPAWLNIAAPKRTRQYRQAWLLSLLPCRSGGLRSVERAASLWRKHTREAGHEVGFMGLQPTQAMSMSIGLITAYFYNP